jgi:hypothetical protein
LVRQSDARCRPDEFVIELFIQELLLLCFGREKPIVTGVWGAVSDPNQECCGAGSAIAAVVNRNEPLIYTIIYLAGDRFLIRIMTNSNSVFFIACSSSSLIKDYHVTKHHTQIPFQAPCFGNQCEQASMIIS